MIGRLVALILLSTVSLIQTVEVPDLMPLTVVQLGDNVTLRCPVTDGDGQFFYWYKQVLGYMVQTVAVHTPGKVTFEGQFKNPRFTGGKRDAEHYLTISNVSKEDEATYFCQEGSAYKRNNFNGTFLGVNDYSQQKFVHLTQSVQLGDSVTLQCSVHSNSKQNSTQCPGEPSVYWFRAGSRESHPAIMYTHWNRSAECEEQKCFYSLSKSIKSSSDVGTYYCAVMTCGEILFSNGTIVDTKPDLYPVVLLLGILLACSVIAIAVLIFSRNRRRDCEHCKGTVSASYYLGHDVDMKSTVDWSSDLDGEADSLNYAGLDFSTRKAKGRKKRESPQESMYAAMRTDWQ
ncbi:uncharacterized protein [Centroberyx affinis]|uniref:uncharacterized protein n=1 Tax=Centroberyx affinis TaxID=166261 RepID=UPI003A5BB3A2